MELRAEHVSRRFFRKGKGTNVFYAVRDAELTLTAGSLTELTGRSGSGKSTLLNLLAGLLEPTEGRVLLDGDDLYALEDEKRSVLRGEKIGVIPQGQSAIHSLTVLENVLLPGWITRRTCGKGRAEELLERVEIAGLRDAYPRELSGGELRRLAIARALAGTPGILLADEPTGDLDDANTKTVLSLLRQSADEGLAVLLVTHEREAADYADRHWRMDAGTLSEQRF